MSVKPLKRSTVETALGPAGSTVQRFHNSTITISSRQRTRKVNRRLLKHITAALLADLGVETAELGVHLIAAPAITRLNEKFLKHVGSTDVITFDYTDNVGRASSLSHFKMKKDGDRRDACPALRGEIIVCMDEAVWQARKFGTSWQSEIVRYVVHGILHLLGHDDRRAGARRKMKREENRRLRELSRRFALSQL
jgi:probable rRNA maturation factor